MATLAWCIVVLVGLQWGDEGKGAVTDRIARLVRYVVRFQGGPNAGHTLWIGGQKIVLHMVPSGIMYAWIVNIIGAGCVLNLRALVNEITDLRRLGVKVTPKNLRISRDATVILPHHPLLDQAREERAGKKKIGTTGRGIGPAYEDRARRVAVRLGDLLNERRARRAVRRALTELELLLPDNGLTVDYVLNELAPWVAELRPYVCDTAAILHKAWERGEKVMCEGAQGTFLDPLFGTYPFVTSASTLAGAACTGLGFGPTWVDAVVGVLKAYTTRVGSGPFPTELTDEIGDYLQRVGVENGATTGRRRRGGWFDAVLAKRAVLLNGATHVVLTKLDVLSGLQTIRVCVGYEGVRAGTFPQDLDRATPIYEDLPGWDQDISACRSYDELPENCRRYVERIERLVGAKIGAIGVGPDREQVILRPRHWPFTE